MSKKTERQAIYNKTEGHCYYCGRMLFNKWHEDHFEPVVRNPSNGKMEKETNDNFKNKVPSCPRCNNWKSSTDIEVFRAMINNLITVLNRDSNKYRMARDFDLIQETGKTTVFYFEGKQPPEKRGILSQLTESEVYTLRNVLRFMKDHIFDHRGSYQEKINVKNIIKKLGL